MSKVKKTNEAGKASISLREYIEEIGDDAKLAARLGVGKTTVGQWRRNFCLPTFERAITIVFLSNGRVSLERMAKDHFSKKNMNRSKLKK